MHRPARRAPVCLADPDRADLAGVAATALVCADTATTTARTLVRHNGYRPAVTRPGLHSCIETCRACYDECRRHALSHEHCRICAEACHRCLDACRAMQATLR